MEFQKHVWAYQTWGGGQEDSNREKVGLFEMKNVNFEEQN